MIVVWVLNATLTATVISWQSVTHVFPGFLTPVLMQLFFPKPLTTFLTCFCRAERRKYARNKVCLTRGSKSQPPGHESDMLTTKPPGQGWKTFLKEENDGKQHNIILLTPPTPSCFLAHQEQKSLSDVHLTLYQMTKS